MSSPYKKFGALANQPKPIKPEDCLVKGKKYEVVKVFKRLSQFKTKSNESIENMVVVIKDGKLALQFFMPYCFNNPSDEDIAVIMKDVESGKPPSIVFYGIVGSARDVQLLEYGQDVDSELVQKINSLEKKRPLDEGSTSQAKSMKMEDGSNI